MDKNGNFTILSDELNGINAPSTWITTDLGLANAYQPMQLNDVYYDENDAVLAVGGMADNTGTIVSVGMVVESVTEGDFTVLAVGAAEQVAATSLTAVERCFYRRCVKINNSDAKPIFAWRLHLLFRYRVPHRSSQPLHSELGGWVEWWGPRIAILDRGKGLPQDFYQTLQGSVNTSFYPPRY